MQQKIILFTLCFLAGFVTIAQQLPLGECGIVCTYDAAGNRTKRLYFCNNGVDPYPLRQANPVTHEKMFTEAELKNAEVQYVDALYPNPTSGIFFIGFSRELINASVNILDVNGKVVQQMKASSTKLTCDLSAFSSGTYFVRIKDQNMIITKKIIKQ